MTTTAKYYSERLARPVTQGDVRISRSKYGSRKTTRGGIRYDSKLEADYAENLAKRKLYGEITKIERQVKIPMHVGGKLICTYIADFKVTLADGKVEYHECKGFTTRVASIKMKLARALYPDWEWVMVRKNKMNYE